MLTTRDKLFSKFIRTSIFMMIVISILVTYYVMVVEKDYKILTNPEGPDTSDYVE